MEKLCIWKIEGATESEKTSIHFFLNFQFEVPVIVANQNKSDETNAPSRKWRGLLQIKRFGVKGSGK